MPSPRFFNVILQNQGLDSVTGLERFVAGARERGSLERMRLTLILHGQEAELSPEARAFFRDLYDQGHEIGVAYVQARVATAEWLGIPEAEITTLATQLFGDADLEAQARGVEAGFRATAHVCVEGNSLAEFWDIPHNWEGAPMFPYWTQWDSATPLRTDRTNRELDKSRATLELHWASRTLWHNYDRFPIPQCWHFGEPLKREQWRVGQLVRPGEAAGWWRVELLEYERNLEAGCTPFLYLNSASEGNVFTPGGAWTPFLDPDEALVCALDLVDLLLARGWQLVTVREFVDWFEARWPCPEAPSMVFLMNDTLANRRDRDGLVIAGHGRLLHAETQRFQVTDHENRMSPTLVVAYDLRTPNLLRGGYTFADPDRWTAEESRDGHYASTTGNALFWTADEPLLDAHGEPYFAPSKPLECRDRTFTLYLGDAWEPYQLVPGRIFGVGREGDAVHWSKEMASPVAGTDIRLVYHHTLAGAEHRVRIEVLGRDAVGREVRFRLCPFFHQGWDLLPTVPQDGSVVPDPGTAGQERNVFGRAGDREFAYSESRPERHGERWRLTTGPEAGRATIRLFNRNPGREGATCDDNPAFNRGFDLSLTDAGEGVEVEWIDEPGPNAYVTAVLHLGPHRQGQEYEFTFRYWHGEPGG